MGEIMEVFIKHDLNHFLLQICLVRLKELEYFIHHVLIMITHAHLWHNCCSVWRRYKASTTAVDTTECEPLLLKYCDPAFADS